MSFLTDDERFWKAPLDLDRITDVGIIRRFLAKVKVDEQGRWMWKGAKNSRGYGVLWVNGHAIGAHRVSYAIFRGPVLQGLTINHIAAVGADTPLRLDVTPTHLELSTLSNNSREANTRRWPVPEEALEPAPF